MSTQSSHSLVIGAIYDAALDPGHWSKALERLAQHFHSASAHLSFDNTAGTRGRLISYGTDPVYSQRYADYYVTRNVLWRRIVQRGLENVVTDRIVMPREELRRSEFYNDFLEPQDGEEILASIALKRAEGGSTFIVWRPRRFGPWGRREMDTLAEMTPHLRRAIQLNGTFGELQVAQTLACEALDRLDHGVVLLDADARIIFANRAAEALLADGAGLRADGRKLTARQSADAEALRRLIGQTGLDGLGGTLVIPREGRPAITVLATPVTRGKLLEGAEAAGTLIVIRDPEAAAGSSLAAFAQHFGLTPAQAALAREVAKGDGVAAAAKRLGIAYGTARAHLLQAFQKTGTRRQAQLARLVMEWRERQVIAGGVPGP